MSIGLTGFSWFLWESRQKWKSSNRLTAWSKQYSFFSQRRKKGSHLILVWHCKEISWIESVLVSSDHRSCHPVEPNEGATSDFFDRQLLVIPVFNTKILESTKKVILVVYIGSWLIQWFPKNFLCDRKEQNMSDPQPAAQSLWTFRKNWMLGSHKKTNLTL